jgi:hypothetical protein
MSYTGSSSFTGAGAQLSVNTSSTSTPSYTVINEVMEANLTGRTAKTVDVTNFSSLKTAEFIAVLVDPGSVDLKISYVSADPGQIQLLTSFNGLTKTLFKLVLPLGVGQTVSGDSYTFSALVTDYSFDVDPQKQILISSKLKISGALTFVEGS